MPEGYSQIIKRKRLLNRWLSEWIETL